jgi:uncharacterized membrane protein AbrB (regulator of aidB expression)
MTQKIIEKDTKIQLPEIPLTWLIGLLMVGLVIMRCFGIDSFTTAALSLVVGFLTGKQIEAAKHPLES